jgi:hypothetical protein
MSYVYNMHNMVEKHFSISIAPVQSRGGSLVVNNFNLKLRTGNAEFSSLLLIAIKVSCLWDYYKSADSTTIPLSVFILQTHLSDIKSKL